MTKNALNGKNLRIETTKSKQFKIRLSSQQPYNDENVITNIKGDHVTNQISQTSSPRFRTGTALSPALKLKLMNGHSTGRSTGLSSQPPRYAYDKFKMSPVTKYRKYE